MSAFKCPDHANGLRRRGVTCDVCAELLARLLELRTKQASSAAQA